MTEETKEESIFEDAAVSEEQGEPEDVPEEVADEDEEDIRISDESPKARLERLGKKEKADKRILTIKSYGFTKIKTKDREGKPIPPKITLSESKSKYYPGKLILKFEEDNLVEYYPNFHYFMDDKGKLNKEAKINRSGNNAVAELFKLAVKLIGKPEDEISDKAFYEFLVGKKVLITTKAGKFNGKDWFRNDIKEFVVD